MKSLREDEPARGVALDVMSGIRRVVAANPGPMTYHGTNTYLLDWPGGVAVLDPGPDDLNHVRDIVQVAAAPIQAILLTHGHQDHWGALPALLKATGAPLYAWHEPMAAEIRPDVALRDGDHAGVWQAIHTPGHAPDHLCFLGPNGVLFSGDHVMGWSTTVVGGSSGNMTDYISSLERLIGTDASIYLPGHGPPIDDPTLYAVGLLKHRRTREAGILRALTNGPAATESLVASLYPMIDPALRPAAERNVLAHLQKLVVEGRAVQDGSLWMLPE